MGKYSILSLFVVTLCCEFVNIKGSSSCPYKVTAGRCPDGTHTCTCPGDRATIRYAIPCEKKFWLTCGRPKNVNHCGRYSLCGECKLQVGNSDMNVCTECLDKGYTGGKCNIDVNECTSNNGNCQQICINTIGSYYCKCRAGFDLVNEKECHRKTCGRPADREGLKFVSAPIRGAKDWEYESAVEYSCSRLHHVIVGNPKQTCLLNNDKTGVEWRGEVPRCAAECYAEVDHVKCGVSGVDPLICDQLGCCNHEQQGTCHMRPGHLYLEYTGVRPKPTSGFKTLKVQDASSCKKKCDDDDACLSFAVVHSDTDITCYQYTRDRPHYISEGEVRTEPNSIYYDPLFFQDDISWTNDRETIFRQFESGCHDRKTVQEYLPLVAMKEKLMSSMKCADTCRDLGYSYSGVKTDECRCGKAMPAEDIVDVVRFTTLNATQLNLCLTNCSGDASQPCGGNGSYTVQHVPKDHRYLGCFDDIIHHMPIRRWTRDANKTVEDCIQECARLHFSYAAVQDGGACFCGPQYPIEAEAALRMCDEPCVADKHDQWCGGTNYNSVYRTPAAFDLTSIEVSHFAASLYTDEEQIESFDTTLFTVFPQLRNFITKKLVLSSSDPFMAPEEDDFCSSGKCYGPCGSLDMGNQVLGDEEHVTIRQFVIRYSAVLDILKDKTPKQVNIYAQVVYIDVHLILEFALVIKARQIFINRELSTYIRQTAAGNLVMNPQEWQRVTREGAYPDMLFERLSYTCARILIASKEQRFINTGHAIINDLITAPIKDQEQRALVRSVMAFRAKMLGIDFTKTHHVPVYTKDHFIEILDTYYNQISIYKTDYDRMNDSKTLYADFLEIAGKMNDIHKSTVVNEALVSSKNIEDTYSEVSEIQTKLEENYINAAKKVDAARETLMKDVQKEYESAKKKARRSFFGFLGNVFKKAFSFGVNLVMQNYIGAAKDFVTAFMIERPYNAQDAFEQLSAMVMQIDIIMQRSKTIMLGDNEIVKEREGEFLIDFQTMVSMSVNIVKWKVMKEYSDIIIADLDLQSANSFRTAMSEYCIWGEAMTQAMVDRAETLRQLLEQRAIYDLRRLQEDRSKEVINAAWSSVDMRIDVMHVMQEQMLDVSLDLNEILLQFCQAYFYENLKECNQEYQPSFGGSMSSLLLKINAARRDSLYSADIHSSVSRATALVNGNNSVDCADPVICPIICLNRNRQLVITVSPNHTDFIDIEKYRVNEINLELRNLDKSQAPHRMKFFMTNTGLFYDRRGGIFNFITRPVRLAFEQELEGEGHVSIQADFPDEIHHITPFTTWMIEISDERGHLDLSTVDEIRMRFHGTGII